MSPDPVPPSPTRESLLRALAGEGLIRLSSVPGLPRIAEAAVVVETSGSTSGRPQVIALSPENLTASASATEIALGGPGAWLLTLPDNHIAGLLVRIRALLADAPLVATTGSFTPVEFVRATQELAAQTGGGRRYCSMVPTQLQRILVEPEAVAAAASLDAVLVGGAATPVPALAAARDAGINVVTSYGMTETTGGCVYDGVPLDGVEVGLDEEAEVGDDDGGGADGAGRRIVLSGPQVALGYVRPTGLVPFHGSFRTADRGRWDGDGRLEVLGRIDDVIVTGAVNVDPYQVESVISTLPGISEVAVVGVPSEEWGHAVVAVVVPTAATDISFLTREIRSTVAHVLGAPWSPRCVVIRDELPRRGPGKVDRRGLLGELVEGLGHTEHASR